MDKIKTILFKFPDKVENTQSEIISISNAEESLEKLRQYLMGVSAWMTGSKLKLNPSKTEFLLIGTKLQREKNLK